MTETVNTMTWPLRVVIILGIVFLLPATVNFGIATFIEKPERPTYPTVLRQRSDKDKEKRAKATAEYNKAMKEYRAAGKTYARTAFWISLPIGLIALCAGIFPGLSEIGIGLMGAGLITVGMSHISFYQGIGDPERFTSLLLGLLVLLFIAYRRLVRPG